MLENLREIIQSYGNNSNKSNNNENLKISAETLLFDGSGSAIKIFIYLINNFNLLSDGFIDGQIKNLPEFRQKKCAAYLNPADKKACILSYLLLESGLREQYKITREIAFIYNKNGKPYLQDFPDIFFNISHCKNNAVCVISDYEIGVDIQDIRLFDIDIARRVCSEKELKRLAESDNSDKLFCRMWTEKESYAKSFGGSVADIFKYNLPAKHFIHRDGENYCMSIYCRQNNF